MEGKPRVALIHDFLVDVRGAERVFLEICDLWPDADVFTAVYDPRGTEGRFEHRNVQSSFLRHLHPQQRTFRALLPFYPAAIESLDLSGYDLVVSSSSAWAHAVIPDPGAVHVSYCHNPFRYAWNDRDRTLSDRPDPISRAVLRGLFRRWRQWDWIAAQRVDSYVTNSRTTQRRIQAYFGRDSRVVYPPVATARFSPAEPGEHYLVLSELMQHKQIDQAVRAFGALDRPLVVAGDGPDLRHLRRIAGPSVSFTGRVTDSEAERLLATSRALVVTAAEEFGIAAVEAQAAGRPVIARAEGGAKETVEDGVTGRLWTGGAEDLAAAVEGFDDRAVDPADCVEQARKFDVARFREELPREVEKAMRRADSGERESKPELRARRRGSRRGIGLR